jgi:hypothetical protein
VSHEPSLALETRSRRSIPNEPRKERAKLSLQSAVDILKQGHPNALLRSITATYNCVGLVVASRRTWVDPAYLLAILVQDGYRRLRGPEEAEVGDVVVYRDDSGEVSHVGLVSRKKIIDPRNGTDYLQVLSKWGADGEYFHDVSDVPYLLGRPTEYWTDRKSLQDA